MQINAPLMSYGVAVCHLLFLALGSNLQVEHNKGNLFYGSVLWEIFYLIWLRLLICHRSTAYTQLPLCVCPFLTLSKHCGILHSSARPLDGYGMGSSLLENVTAWSQDFFLTNAGCSSQVMEKKSRSRHFIF